MIFTGAAEGYFFDLITKAVGDSEITPSDEVIYYLCSMLESYTKTNLPVEALAVKVLDTSPVAFMQLKEVGDSSLLVTGFYPESITPMLVNETYFLSLGSIAYKECSGRTKHSALAEIFDELGSRFPEVVEIISRAKSFTY